MAAENDGCAAPAASATESLTCPPSAYIGVQMALRAALELNVFNIMAEFGPPGTQISSAQIVSKLSTTNPNATKTLHRILRWLSVNSFLTTSLPDNSTREEERLFGLTDLTANVTVHAEAGIVLLNTEPEVMLSLLKLKDLVLDPQGKKSPFEITYGVGMYDYLGQRPDSRLNTVFNQSMGDSTKLFFDNVLFRVYRGFSEVVELMDVGGNIGTTVKHIISVYPNIRGINFDLPHVIALAPSLNGVKHVAGDMFESLPSSKTILLKWVLHNWADEQCLQLLQNCWKALPEDGGKVILLEFVVPKLLESSKETLHALAVDFFMLTLHSGKERTLSEFQELAITAGFSRVNNIPIGNGIYVLEFLK